MGGSGADSLTGNALANLFRGGLGADVLDGAGGLDAVDYRDKTAAVAVTLNGAANAVVTVGGLAEDTIRNMEHVYGGSGADTLTGDFLTNTFRGGGGADTLDGASNSDRADYSDRGVAIVVTLNGATNAAVTVGGLAEDTVRNIENVIGGSGADSLTGDALANRFSGRAGNDTLTGGAAADTFLFNAPLNATTNLDHVTDFANVDTIQLENAIFTALTTTGTLAAEAFHSAAGATSGQDADDRIVHNTTTGALYYDADGLNGLAAVQFAVLDNLAIPTNANFVVV